MSSSPRLPNELSDQVIQNLRDDSKTLANCALVCLAWVPASQHNMFSKLAIHERNCRQIVAHLSSTSSRIAGYVRHLYIFLWGNLRANMQLRFRADKTPLLDLILPHMSVFTNVEELSLDGVRVFHDLNWDVAWTDLLAHAFSALTVLRVIHLTFEDLPHLVDLVSSFPQLLHLLVDNIDIAEASLEYTNKEQESYKGPRTPPTQLKNIKYSSTSFASGGGPFLSWLAAGPQAFSTLHLDLNAEAGEFNEAAELIKASGVHLKELLLAFGGELRTDMGFSENSNLQTLVLPRIGDFGDQLVGVLQSIKSPIKHLAVGDIYRSEEGLRPLFQVLMSPSFSSLEKVYFYVALGSAEDLQTEVSNTHPELLQRGIATFENKETYELFT